MQNNHKITGNNLLQRMMITSIILCLRFYQWCISPLYIFIVGTHAVCRFNPSCSEYASQAFLAHGVRRGFLLTISRLLRCHPFSRTPHEDPIPFKNHF